MSPAAAIVIPSYGRPDLLRLFDTDPTLDGSYPSYGHYNLTSSRSICASRRTADSGTTAATCAQYGDMSPVIDPSSPATSAATAYRANSPAS